MEITFDLHTHKLESSSMIRGYQWTAKDLDYRICDILLSESMADQNAKKDSMNQSSRTNEESNESPIAFASSTFTNNPGEETPSAVTTTTSRTSSVSRDQLDSTQFTQETLKRSRGLEGSPDSAFAQKLGSVLLSEEDNEQQKRQRRAAQTYTTNSHHHSEREMSNYDENKAGVVDTRQRGMSITRTSYSPKKGVPLPLNNDSRISSSSHDKAMNNNPTSSREAVDLWQTYMDQKDKEERMSGKPRSSSWSHPRRMTSFQETSTNNEDPSMALSYRQAYQYPAPRPHSTSYPPQMSPPHHQETLRQREYYDSQFASSNVPSRYQDGEVEEGSDGIMTPSSSLSSHYHRKQRDNDTRGRGIFPPPSSPRQHRPHQNFYYHNHMDALRQERPHPSDDSKYGDSATTEREHFHPPPKDLHDHSNAWPAYPPVPPLNEAAYLPDYENSHNSARPRRDRSIRSERYGRDERSRHPAHRHNHPPSSYPPPAIGSISSSSTMSSRQASTSQTHDRLQAYPMQNYCNREILALSTSQDENWLSEFLCFVRSECVEVFTASEEDVASRMNSKKVLLGQVGIRCRFCAHMSHRDRAGRSSSFPSSLSRIYQSLTMMLRDHFTKCHMMPHHVKEQYLSLKANTSQGATDSKKYWVESAQSLGLVDTDGGIRFMDNETNSDLLVPVTGESGRSS